MFIPIDVGVSIYLGWLTLSLLIINEARSIVENLIESNVKVPKWLSNSLEVYQNSVESIVKKKNKASTKTDIYIKDKSFARLVLYPKHFLLYNMFH